MNDCTVAGLRTNGYATARVSGEKAVSFVRQRTSLPLAIVIPASHLTNWPLGLIHVLLLTATEQSRGEDNGGGDRGRRGRERWVGVG